ncbi:chemokine-like receptor 1 [Triplophysa dalaica]|uniref:chemokine-like receptor 1 n=1 Tax=Triplophysa dalaica TaxID=1582913 RepID=UPI0024DF5B1A|nr:chemokine-like receptor 1 [Triplophysa dalaica]
MESADFVFNSYDENSYENSFYNNSETIGEEVSFVVPTTKCFTQVMCLFLLVVNVIVFLLGIGGNGVVIWIAGFAMKKSVNTTWYLSLAVSDFIFCSCLPFNIVYSVMPDWIFGLFMCKFTSFVMFLNMFSSIFLLVIMSADRCVSVMFPVWAQNHRTIGKALLMIVLAWVVSAALSIPSMVYRDVQNHLGTNRCMNTYTSPYTHETIALSRFIFGFVIPFLLIIVSYTIIICRLRASHMTKSSKPFKIMTVLILTFFLCWLPYHTFVLIELYHSSNLNEVVTHGLRIGTTVATANSFLNPVLYAFMGNDFRKNFKSSILSKIENAIGEEGRTMSRYLSRSSSVDARASTHI